MAHNNAEQTLRHSDFSIDHILNRAGSSYSNSEKTGDSDKASFQWLQCSRYCPPRIPRIHKKEAQKRQLGRHPRIPFTTYQLSILEQKFKESPYLGSEEVMTLSNKLQLADIRVKIWFQNRRARERREKLRGDNQDKMQDDAVDEKLLGSSRPQNPEEFVADYSFKTSFTNNLVLPSGSSTGHHISDIYNNSLKKSILLSTGLPLFIPSINFVNKSDVNS
ncbi:unnamed protein product [Ceutorhynchus assimilis]|uniref:Homeobox domain-containing protein n=1 Tax=Ceutorhynchus assimilis TaxID=467358 RepID=A0A9N9MME5_9CUCU|nr:unnamed protein product [Ceutorhynchus assimilis]